MATFKWRGWLRAIHRDVGYICAGLTVIYAVSGIAVNHVQDWNPSYAIEKVASNIGPVEHSGPVDDALARVVLARLDLAPTYRTLFEPAPGALRILRENHTIDVDLGTGRVQHEFVTPRAGLHQANYLHLNHAKGIWTWLADAFAVALAFLALSGLFMIKGHKGITGRGLWLTLAGCAVPLVILWWYA
jgi:hypothetical protein